MSLPFLSGLAAKCFDHCLVTLLQKRALAQEIWPGLFLLVRGWSLEMRIRDSVLAQKQALARGAIQYWVSNVSVLLMECNSWADKATTLSTWVLGNTPYLWLWGTVLCKHRINVIMLVIRTIVSTLRSLCVESKYHFTRCFDLSCPLVSRSALASTLFRFHFIPIPFSFMPDRALSRGKGLVTPAWILGLMEVL